MTPLRHIPSNRNDPYFNWNYNTLEMIFYNTVYIVYHTKDTRSKLVSIKMGISAPWLLFRSGYFSGKQRVPYYGSTQHSHHAETIAEAVLHSQ